MEGTNFEWLGTPGCLWMENVRTRASLLAETQGDVLAMVHGSTTDVNNWYAAFQFGNVQNHRVLLSFRSMYFTYKDVDALTVDYQNWWSLISTTNIQYNRGRLAKVPSHWNPERGTLVLDIVRLSGGDLEIQYNGIVLPAGVERFVITNTVNDKVFDLEVTLVDTHFGNHMSLIAYERRPGGRVLIFQPVGWPQFLSNWNTGMNYHSMFY